MQVAIKIGNSYLDMTGGDVVDAVRQHGHSAAADILIAHIARSDAALAGRLADAVEG
ncbi:MAG: hypothetical protein PHE17_20905 [Thiothrix sp.]|uniref:hypothetical protein n=1 Tax=Thiothrix sp. TaxID=1032 RepID=UPI0026335951|nr:hypothetical protein [Thiothrix sp.]MDD5395491.1 hypothetical protein [Thiothrix sp.]